MHQCPPVHSGCLNMWPSLHIPTDIQGSPQGGYSLVEAGTQLHQQKLVKEAEEKKHILLWGALRKRSHTPSAGMKADFVKEPGREG